MGSNKALILIDAANGIWTDDQRKVFNEQAKSLLAVADNIALSTNFNGTGVLSADLTLTLQVGTTAKPQDQIQLEFANATTAELTGGGNMELDTAAKALTAITTVGEALKNIRSQREKIGQAQVAMEYNINNRQSMNEQHLIYDRIYIINIIFN